jgi:hypothetical protein
MVLAGYHSSARADRPTGCGTQPSPESAGLPRAAASSVPTLLEWPLRASDIEERHDLCRRISLGSGPAGGGSGKKKIKAGSGDRNFHYDLSALQIQWHGAGGIPVCTCGVALAAHRGEANSRRAGVGGCGNGGIGNFLHQEYCPVSQSGISVPNPPVWVGTARSTPPRHFPRGALLGQRTMGPIDSAGLASRGWRRDAVSDWRIGSALLLADG